MNMRQDEFAERGRPIPRFAMTADEVCASLGISATTLDLLVAEGIIPKGFAIPGHPRLVRWDPEDIRATVKDWKEHANIGEGAWSSVR